MEKRIRRQIRFQMPLDELDRTAQEKFGEGFNLTFDHDLINTIGAGVNRLAEGRVAACGLRKFKRHMLDDVTKISALI